MLYFTKNEKNKIISLFSFLIANAFFAVAFCLLFVSDLFYYDYYNWLKLIDAISFVLLGAGIVVGGMLLTKHYLNKKRISGVLWNVFTVLEIIILVLVIINVISFYEGIVFILLLVGVACYAVGAIGGIIYYNTATLVETQLKHKKPVEEFVYVSNPKTKLKSLVNVKDLDKNSRVINLKMIVGEALTMIVCLISSVLFFVLAPDLTTEKGLVFTFVVAISLVLVLSFCWFSLPLFNSNKTSFLANRWATWCVVCINELLFVCCAGFMYLGLGGFVSVVYPIVAMILLNVSSVLIINDYAKMKYLFNSNN